MLKRLKQITLFIATLIVVADAYSQTGIDRQKQYLNDFEKIAIPQRIQANTRRTTWQDSTWKDWLNRSGELPPDFSQMKSIPFLPDPLMQVKDGKDQKITTKADWEVKRVWIKEQYQKYISGVQPPAPKDFKTRVLSDRVEDGTRIQMIETSFGPGYKAKITFELMIPAGKGPFPVYMTQWNHRNWAQLAVRRGYIGCVYAAADTKDDTQAYQILYPEYDFSMLMRRAWGASRVVDYLITQKEVKKEQIAITGHSRNGKQALWAAAFDDRFAAAIPVSSSTGGDSPWRFGDPQYASETIDLVTGANSHWFIPQLRFFFGHEDKLPVDQNSLAALVAPRPLLLHYSLVEAGLNSWAIEQNYYSAKKVYDFLGARDKIGVFNRYGNHFVAARDIEYGIDFLDIQFNRNTKKWHNNLYYEYDYAEWEKKHASDKIVAGKIKPIILKDKYKSIQAFEEDKKQIAENLQWILGKEPSGVKPTPMVETVDSRRDWLNSVIQLPNVPGSKLNYFGAYTSMGDNLNGFLYYPVDKSGKMKLQPNGKLPVIVYSHQYAHSTGFAKGYTKNGGNGTGLLFKELISRGFAVLAIDMYGFGARIEEAKDFYDRYPEWSKMGKYVQDVKSSIDGLETLDYIDKSKIYLLGNTLGGSVSLITAALDSRVAGVAAVAAFSPWRTSDDQFESIRTYSNLHGSMPRLGFFAENPKNTPVDFGEIISAIAPRPLLIIAPELDRYTDIPALKSAMTPVFNVYDLYKQKANLMVEYPREINRMTDSMTKEVGEFYSKLLTTH
ncbi:alpha/beta hydrolase family protein [Pedobacter arcticus]|uniref:alpha/beta hydrolase family protein n=1 Tax=Pedobacter arcticus TaxID=752140 RepID=UPI0002E2B11E|nr:dienelactone hydrolase family protein [Pedobacter arcticus]